MKINLNAPVSYNGSLLSSASSNVTINATNGNTFAATNILEFGLLNLSGNVVAALDVDGNGTFASGDIVLDVADNITSAQYNYNSDTFQFFV